METPILNRIRIVKQPNGNYAIFDWYKAGILAIDLRPTELFDSLKKLSDEFNPYRTPDMIAWYMREFGRTERGEPSFPSWRDMVGLAYTEPSPDCEEENLAKIGKAVALGLISESDLDEFRRAREDDRVPLAKRKIVPISVFQTPLEDLELSVHLQLRLRKLGVKMLGDIVRYSEEDLRKEAKIFGRRLKTLKDALWEYRLVLGQ